MKALDRRLVQEIVDSIQSGDINEAGVRSLIITLRDHSNQFKVFTEVSHFVAHTVSRKMGMSNSSIERMKLIMEFFQQYISPKKKLSLIEPFPAWIKRLMILQVDRLETGELKKEFNLSHGSLKRYINEGFVDIDGSNNVIRKVGKLPNNALNAISRLLSFISGNASFTHEEFLEELIQILAKNRINFDKKQFTKHSDRLVLFIILLMHKVKYFNKKIFIGETRISAEKESILHGVNFIDKDGNEVEDTQTFGTLNVLGISEIDNGDKPLKVAHVIMTTNLTAKDYCEDSLFEVAVNEKFNAPNTYMMLNLDNDLKISTAYKLEQLDG